MNREAQSPYRDKHRDQLFPPNVSLRCQRKRQPRDDDETQSPEDIDNTDIFQSESRNLQ